jgi:hypothetical protein
VARFVSIARLEKIKREAEMRESIISELKSELKRRAAKLRLAEDTRCLSRQWRREALLKRRLADVKAAIDRLEAALTGPKPKNAIDHPQPKFSQAPKAPQASSDEG